MSEPIRVADYIMSAIAYTDVSIFSYYPEAVPCIWSTHCAKTPI